MHRRPQQTAHELSGLARLTVEDSQTASSCDRLSTVSDFKLLIDFLAVGVHRALGDVQLCRNLLIEQAPPEQVEDFQLAVGQLLDRWPTLPGLPDSGLGLLSGRPRERR